MNSSIELLEHRIAPAGLTFVSKTTATYTDPDGDLVTVVFSKPLLIDGAMGNLNTVLVTAAAGDGFRLDQINLTNVPEAVGTGITVTAKIAGKGDGLANVGKITASADLGVVSIKGDLGEIDAGGVGDTSTPGVRALNVQSFGRAAAVAGTVLDRSDIQGALGTLTVKTDFIGAILRVRAAAQADAKIGAITIGGSIVGATATASGSIDVDGNIGAVKIGGSIRGGLGGDTGQIFTNTGSIASLTVGGSIVGGASQNTGKVFAFGTIGAIKIARDLRGGNAASTGLIDAGAGLGAVTIGGSVIGGTGSLSGTINSGGGIGAVKIGGDLRGGGSSSADVDTGEIFAQGGSIASVTIGGDAVATNGTFNGAILARDSVGPVKIAGSIDATGDGTFIIRGQGTALKPLAIASLTVTGSVSDALVLGGYGFNNTPANGNASIGAVKVGGDWTASSIAAGVQNTTFGNFGNSGDSLIQPTTLASRIASITIGGAVAGTAGGTDHFGFVARAIGKVTVGGSAIPLVNPGLGSRALGLTGDFAITQIPLAM